MNFGSLMLNEIGNADYRTFVNGFIQVNCSVFEAIWVVIGYYVSSWKFLATYTIGLPFLVSVLGYFWVVESPLFLIAQNKHKKFVKVIKYIAKTNGKKLDANWEAYYLKLTAQEIKDKQDKQDKQDEELISQNYDIKEKQKMDDSLLSSDFTDLTMTTDNESLIKPKKQKSKKSKIRLLDLFRKSELRKGLIVTGIQYFAVVYIFYASIFGIEALKGSIYFNMMFLAVSDIIGSFMIAPILKRFKRKPSVYVTLVLMGIVGLGFIFVQVPKECILDDQDYCWQKIFQAGSVGLIRILLLILLGIVYIYMSEVFPAEYRGIGTGFVSLIGRFGGLLAPFVCAILITKDIYPQISFAGIAVVVIIVTIPAKETFGKLTERKYSIDRDYFSEKVERPLIHEEKKQQEVQEEVIQQNQQNLEDKYKLKE